MNRELMEQIERELDGHYFRSVGDDGEVRWMPCTGISEEAGEYLNDL